ncbi:hypothetical protein HL658_04110 [Azospirillum sp. RWY-5-1]|uniref:Uncharacterized protein n=1 Tax=Azospirillum oleiclasticum TaxID=2735135 RepID=A0ABX2T3J8_9PROT|nr:hypothetical protein [Azospirillum oleiclasticum]NYZ11723.1 hypothetical protein [Azospirillum oleiclasticum]NYZ18884.1 hypothetical protein [Azospirillum oleiclasticum]
MPMNVLEVAVYAMVLSNAQPTAFECVAVQPEGVNCTNGLYAKPEGESVIAFNTGVKVLKGNKGQVSLTNGLTTYFDASAWVSFKNGKGDTLVSVRKTAPYRFRFSNGYTCAIAGKESDIATCFKS